MFSQTIQPTKEQQAIINTLFTPEKIIEYSKVISNESVQYTIIKNLEAKIDSLKVLASQKDEVILKYGTEIVALNNLIRDTNNEENEVADNQLKDAKKPFLGLHLDIQLQTRQLELNHAMFSTNLYYRLKKVTFGATLWTQSESTDGNTFTNKVYYGPFVKYNIF